MGDTMNRRNKRKGNEWGEKVTSKRKNDTADREVDLERKKFHLDDYSIFQASEVAGGMVL
jgi:hypothetical protein